MRKLLFLIVFVLFCVGSAQAEVSWNTNDDEMTGERRAVVHILSEASNAMLTIRVDSEDSVWIIYIPSKSVSATRATLLARIPEDSRVARIAVYDTGSNDTWTPESGEMDISLIKLCMVGSTIKVQLRTDSKQYAVDKFGLTGVTAAMDKAYIHVFGHSTMIKKGEL